MSASTRATIINGSFEVPLRGCDLMLKFYITLAVWIFIAGVGAHAHMRNHFRSGGLSILMLLAFLTLLINPDNTLGYRYCRRERKELVIFPEKEGPSFLWGMAAFFCFGVSVVGPVIEEAQLNLNGRTMRRLVITTLYNINLFMCLSAFPMIQSSQRFLVFVGLAIIVILFLVKLIG